MPQPAANTALDIIDQQLLRWHDNIELHAQDCLKIKDHQTAKILPFIYNKGQKILHNVAEKQKKETGIVRILLLKSRRFGGSTYVEGRFYSNTSQNFNRYTFIIAHEEKSTTTLFRMAKLMHQLNPAGPSTLASNAKELRFDTSDGKGLRSEYQLATAKTVDAGRSQGIHYLHSSEEAFWMDGRPLLDGILQCVPDPPAESEVFRESTANGYGNSFQEDVAKAYAEGRYAYYSEGDRVYAWHNPESQSDWILVFIPWFIIERYTKDFKNDQEKERFIKQSEKKVFDESDLRWVDSEAINLRKKYNLSWERLNWRQWAIENKCGGSVDKFHQEYPSNVEEAFLSEGSNVFGKVLCDDLEALCEQPIVIGDPVIRAGLPRIKRNPYGRFSLWEKPSKDETYFMTVDAAGGKHEHEKQEDATRDPDYTCIDIYNHRTGTQCAQWHGHIDYDLIADIAEIIGDMYFRCPAVVELFNHGYTVVAFLKRKNYPMYEHKPDQPGWITTRSEGNTKADAVDSFYKATRDGDLQIKCKETVSEMRVFIEKNAKFGAASGCNDDRITCGCIAAKMLQELPKKWEDIRNKSKKKKSVGFSNWGQKQLKERAKPDYMEVRVN